MAPSCLYRSQIPPWILSSSIAYWPSILEDYHVSHLEHLIHWTNWKCKTFPLLISGSLDNWIWLMVLTQFPWEWLQCPFLKDPSPMFCLLLNSCVVSSANLSQGRFSLKGGVWSLSFPQSDFSIVPLDEVFDQFFYSRSEFKMMFSLTNAYFFAVFFRFYLLL